MHRYLQATLTSTKKVQEYLTESIKSNAANTVYSKKVSNLAFPDLPSRQDTQVVRVRHYLPVVPPHRLPVDQVHRENL